MKLQSLKALGQRVLGTTREKVVFLKEGLASRWSETAAAADAADADTSEDADTEVKELLSEQTLSFNLLRLSVAAVAFKALHYLVKRKYDPTALIVGLPVDLFGT